ncbi:MAG: hypothetical protein N2Z70_01255 [Bdellovibrionaceae bacterium]|jgi:exopolyphosphatase/guanosine-5'-triphosphate,3'-diphosphate pyrophosphatase|nr:hypothetical protein [Pseudobdellovibrionaceae bacterium]
MRLAALDLGSNTFILTVADYDPTKNSWQVLCDEVRYVRLGERLEERGEFLPQALERAQNALAEFSALIHRFSVTKLAATATSAARDAKNGHELFKLCAQVGIPVQIISGQEEARLTFQGATFFSPQEGNYWVIDIGGGSTEMIFGSRQGIAWSHSLDLGCVRLKDRWGRDAQAMEKQILSEMEQVVPHAYRGQSSLVIGVAGTPVELLRVHLGSSFSWERVEGYSLSRANVASLKNLIVSKSPQELTWEFGTPEGRADVLLHGVLLLSSFMQISDTQELKISRSGIRYGVLLSLV